MIFEIPNANHCRQWVNQCEECGRVRSSPQADKLKCECRTSFNEGEAWLHTEFFPLVGKALGVTYSHMLRNSSPVFWKLDPEGGLARRIPGHITANVTKKVVRVYFKGREALVHRLVPCAVKSGTRTEGRDVWRSLPKECF